MTSLPKTTPAQAGARLYRATILLVSCVSSYLIVSDVAMVNVALPSIGDGLHFTPSDTHWFLTCYALAFSALPLCAGRAADRFGHVQVFAVGLVIFCAAAAMCGCVSTPSLALLARTVQGVGGSIVAATTLSLLTYSFTDAAGRRRALAVWSATVSGGAAAGVLLGGVLTAELGWRWVFLISAGIGGLCLLMTTTQLLGRDRSTVVPGRHLDVVGGVLISLGLGCLVLGLSQAQSIGWTSTSARVELVVGVLLIALFLTVETRSADPLLPLGLLRSRTRLGANTVTAIVGADLYFMYFAISVYLQRVQGNGPLEAGVKSLPAALAVVAGALGSTYLSRVLSPRRQLLGSMLTLAAGFLWLSRLGIGSDYWPHLGLPLIVIGSGFGTSFVPATIIATAGVPGHRAGVASGLVNSSRQLGRALGLAALSGLAVAPRGRHAAATIVSGDSHAFIICALAALLGAIVVWLLLPKRKPAPNADVPSGVLPLKRDPAMT